MKKRTLVCFLIFTLCVFHILITDTAFGQDATPEELAQQVFDEHNLVLRRADIKQYLPSLLEGLKGELPFNFTPAQVINLAVNSVKTDPTGAALKRLAEGQGLTLTDDHIALIADADVQAVLAAENTNALLSLTGEDLAAGLDKFLELINASEAIEPPKEPTDPPKEPTDPPKEPTDPPKEPTDPPKEPTDPPKEPTDPPKEPTDPPKEPTDPPKEPTDPPKEPTDPPKEPTDPPTMEELPPVNLVTSDLNGRSRLGGLSLNRVYGRGFIRSLIRSAGLTGDADAFVEPTVDFVLAQIPQGFLPKKQIRQILTAQRPSSIFLNESAQLDYENFGNAISPALTELLYTNGDRESKYLASDNMNVYVRVPNTLAGGSVHFGLNGNKAADAKRISPTEFQADTVPYTFKLEETLAATNLPAWPGSGLQIFSEVVLRYSQEGLDGQYISLQLDPYHEDKGVVWKGDVGVIPGRNVFYYFEVTLTEPVMLNIVNPVALGEAVISPDGTHDEEATKTYTIDSWAMPDPRNLQFQDRGIIEALITPDVGVEIARIAANAGLLGGQGQVKPIQLRDLNKLGQLLGRNANNLLTEFESTFDPRLASVFTIPAINYDTESLWVANIDSIVDGAANLQAVVMNADGEAVDHIKVDFNADSSAPEATLRVGPANTDTSGYWNKDRTFVSTNKMGDPAALLNIDSVLTKGMLGRDDGWLLYQVIDLDSDGNPVGTWLPLTVESSMLASDLWKIAQEQLAGNTNPTIQLLQGFDLDTVLSFVTPAIIQQFGNPILATLNIRPINDERSQFIVDLLGAVVADIDSIPLTFDAERDMTMAFGKGEYGLRALGIDNILNVGSHVGPTRLRIVDPEYDNSSVTLASLGDINFNDKDDDYENNVIYNNTRDVTLTVTVNERTVHPGMIKVEYENADGEWVTIGEPVELVEAEHPDGTIFKVTWNVSDFDDLVAAGEYVRVRTVTSNALDLTTTTPEADYFMIKLDADVHPVDPKVLVVDVDDSSIVMTNPDSGAPQGMIQLIGYTPRRTVPATANIRVEARRMNDDAWEEIGAVELSDPAGMSGTDTAAIMFNGKALSDVYVDDMLHIQDSGSYLKWVITVDTKALDDEGNRITPDSIAKDNLAAAHAASNPDEKSYAELDTNRYMVRAYAVGDDDSNISDAVSGSDYTDMFSVDNDDDVAPLGQNMITVSQDNVEVTPNGDGSFDVGGLVDKYDPDVDSPIITLTIKPGAKRNTYDSVHLYTSLPEGAIIGDVTETSEGSGEYTVMVDVGTLMDSTGLEMEPDGNVHNDRYLEDTYHANPDEFVYNPKGEVFSFTVHALTEDAAKNRQDKDKVLNADLSETTAHEITVNVQNSYRPDPGVLAITVENSDGMVNPDSKAPKYELTFNAYTWGQTSPSLSSPPTGAVRFEVKRPDDETWERIAGTVEAEMVADADLDDITTGLIQITQNNVLTGGDSAVAIPALMKYSVTVDTREFALLDRTDEPIKLGDTIKRGDAAERDVSLDGNQYRVRAIALTPKNLDHPEYPQVDGVDAHFSLDNDDDVPPLGPANITDVSDRDAYGDMQPIEKNEDDSYNVGGIVDPGVASPVAIFHIEPDPEKVEEITYAGGSLKLVQTAPDGTETVADGSLEDGYVEIDVGLLDNGTYIYYALTVDEHGNVQDQEESPSPVTTVHVSNFRVSDIEDLVVTSVDGVAVDGELPERIPLRESISVSFKVPKGTLMVEDLTDVHVNGEKATYTPGSDAENAFTLMASDLSKIESGHYTVRGEVTKRNGSVTFPMAMVNLDNTVPMITFVTPTEGATVNDSPTLHAMYNDGALGVGISLDTAMVSLARVKPDSEVQEEMTIKVDQSMVDQDIDSVVYTRINKLAGGAYKFTVNVTDSLGNVGEESVYFAVEGVDPTVTITAPLSGQEFEASPDSITGFFSGGGDVSVTKFTLDGVDVDVSDDSTEFTSDGNSFTYMPEKGFSEKTHEVVVQVTDGSGITAETALTFTVEYPVPTATIVTPTAGQIYNHGMPIITGTFSGAAPVTGTLTVTDSKGDTIVTEDVSGSKFEYTPDTKEEALGHGSYTVSITVTDGNKKPANASTDFTVEIPGPSVAIHGPAAGQMFDHGLPVITVESSAEAGVKSVSVTIDGDDAVMGKKEGTYIPEEPLKDGDYTVVATATDVNGNDATATVIFTVEIPGPSIAIHAPASGQVYEHGKPKITVEYSGEAEIDKDKVTVTVDGEEAVLNETDGTYSPAEDLTHGDYRVVATVEDVNKKSAEATAIFYVDIPGPTVVIHSPGSGINYNHDDTEIKIGYSGTDAKVTTFTIDGGDIEVPDGNPFTYNAKDLGDGEHRVAVEVTDANGKTAEATTVYNVEFPEASVTLLSPLGGHVFSHGKPIISGEFIGVGKVDVVLTVDGKAVATQKVEDNGFTATSPELGHGPHTILVSVKDENGEEAQTGATFTVDIPGPSVAILSPAPGQTYDHGEPVIRVEYAGTEVGVTTFTVNGEDVEGIEPEDNAFKYTPTLGDGEHKVVVEVTDENKKTAQASVVFNVAIPKDKTPPVISEVSPSGVIRLSASDVIGDSYGVTIAAVITDEQSDIFKMEYAINRGTTIRPHPDAEKFQIYPVSRAGDKFEVSESFDLGTHQIVLRVESEGGVREYSWQFTLEADITPPTITSITPSGTIHAGMPPISASAVDSSTVTAMTIRVKDSLGEIVEGKTMNDMVKKEEEETDDGEPKPPPHRPDPGVTRVDFIPERPLREGTYTIEVRATDLYNNSTTATGVFTVDFDTAAPIITSYSPHNGARLIYKHNEVAKPTISITYGDAETGVNVDSVRLSIEGPAVKQVINLTDEQKSASQVVYTPSEGFKEPGQYTVILEVSDNAHQQGNVSEESDHARQANQVVHKFSFFVEYTDAPVLMAPFNFPNPFADNTRISFGLNQMSVVSIVIYDSTLRPVRVLVDNKLMPAGNHTGGNGIGWDGRTSSGERLARGIYYCQIVVTGSFESEYAILKLALTGAE